MKNLLWLGVPLLAATLAGCQGELNTRPVKSYDTADVWSARLPTMPMDTHLDASLPQFHLRDVPNGTTPQRYGAHATLASLYDAPRVELYVGGQNLPTSDSWCSAQPALHPVHAPGHGVMVAAAICDGPRLVLSARRVVPQDQLAAEQTQVMDEIKTRLLFGLSISDAQQPYEPYSG